LWLEGSSAARTRGCVGVELCLSGGAGGCPSPPPRRLPSPPRLCPDLLWPLRLISRGLTDGRASFSFSMVWRRGTTPRCVWPPARQGFVPSPPLKKRRAARKESERLEIFVCGGGSNVYNVYVGHIRQKC
jgi:hypothetical protein